MNFALGPSLGVSRVSNYDHFVARVRVSKQEHFERTHFDRSFRAVVLKWNVHKNDIRIVRSKFILQSCYRIVSQLMSVLSKIKYLSKKSNCHHTYFSRWSHNTHDRSAVDLMGFCDERCALSLVQRHALVFVQVWRET